jgi:hypothetical protein
METGGWNYAKRGHAMSYKGRTIGEIYGRTERAGLPRRSWSAPRVVQVFEGIASAEYGLCLDGGCHRHRLGERAACRPICEIAVEARLRTLGTGATSPDGPTYFDQPSDLTPDRFGVDWTEDAPRPMVLTPWNMRGK